MTRRFRVSLTAQAEEDLIAIWLAVAEKNPIAGDRFLSPLDDSIDSLVEHPHRGASRPELGKDMHVLVDGDFLIIYRAQKSGVTVVRVMQGARDLRKLLLED